MVLPIGRVLKVMVTWVTDSVQLKMGIIKLAKHMGFDINSPDHRIIWQRRLILTIEFDQPTAKEEENG